MNSLRSAHAPLGALTFTLLLLLTAMAAACGSSDSGSPGTSTDAAGDLDSEAAEIEAGETSVALPAELTDPAPFGVGVTDILVSYEDPDVPGRIRDLPGLVWYPTRDATGAFYLYQGLLASDVALKDAAAVPGPFPMLIFSHGSGAIAEQSWLFTEYLASHGVVVAAVNHVGDNVKDWIKQEFGTMPQAVHDRPYDIRHLVDFMIAANAEAGGRLEGLIDPERIGMAGHSLGGFTTLMSGGAVLHVKDFLASCAADPTIFRCDMLGDYDTSMIKDGAVPEPRIKFGFAMAPPGYLFFSGADGLSHVNIPMLIAGGDRDGMVPLDQDTIPIYNVLQAPKILMVLEGAAHFSFANMCDVLGSANEYIANEGCDPEQNFISQDVAFAAMNRYGLAMVRLYLDHDESWAQVLTAADYEAQGFPGRMEGVE